MSSTTHRGAQPNILQSEPVSIGGGILVLGNLIIGALPLFGVPLSGEQVGVLNLIFSAVVALATAIIRQYVTPKAKVAEQTKKLPTGKTVIVAGAANELPTGEVIREPGILSPEA